MQEVTQAAAEYPNGDWGSALGQDPLLEGRHCTLVGGKPSLVPIAIKKGPSSRCGF